MPLRVGLRIGHHPLLQQLNRFAEYLQDGNVLINADVDQRIEQLLGPVLTKPPFAAAQPLTHRSKDVRSVL